MAINGMPDHLHVFVGLHTTQSIADLMRVVKGESSEWINNRGSAINLKCYKDFVPTGLSGPEHQDYSR